MCVPGRAAPPRRAAAGSGPGVAARPARARCVRCQPVDPTPVLQLRPRCGRLRAGSALDRAALGHVLVRPRSESMNKLILLGVVVVAACQADNKNLERKIDDLNKKLDTLSAQLGRGGGAGAAAQRPARPEPDRTKTYAVPVDGDPAEGPADAKSTVVKAYDYACPFCEKVRGSMDDLRKKYPNDLRIVYKQFVVHPQIATAGALAVCAADKQG